MGIVPFSSHRHSIQACPYLAKCAATLSSVVVFRRPPTNTVVTSENTGLTWTKAAQRLYCCCSCKLSNSRPLTCTFFRKLSLACIILQYLAYPWVGSGTCNHYPNLEGWERTTIIKPWGWGGHLRPFLILHAFPKGDKQGGRGNCTSITSEKKYRQRASMCKQVLAYETTRASVCPGPACSHS